MALDPVKKRVAASIAFLVAVAGAVGLTNLVSGPSHKNRESMQLAARLKLVGSALMQYQQDNGKLPGTLGALTETRGAGSYLNERALLDPWNVPLFYRLIKPPESFVVFSLGSDGILGGEGNGLDRQVTALEFVK